MMKWRYLCLALMFTVSACASTQRVLSYPAGWPDADVYVGGSRYQVWFHERDQSVLVLRGDPRPLGQLMAQNMTVYANDASPSIFIWGAAANAVLNPLGCAATEVTGADQMREIAYRCRETINIGDEVQRRRAVWRQGVHVNAPPLPPQ